jgi:hypothetical protein
MRVRFYETGLNGEVLDHLRQVEYGVYMYGYGGTITNYHTDGGFYINGSRKS